MKYSIMPPFTRSLLLTFIVSGVAFTQSVSVSVRSAIDAALRNHASIRIAGERVNAAEAQYDEAGARLLPKLQVTGRAFQLSDVKQGTITVPFLPGSPSIPLFPVIRHSYAARLQLSQPLFNGFRLREGKDAARYGFEAAEAERTRSANDLAFDVEAAYWTWLQARETRKVMEETVSQMKDHEARVEKMAEQGLTTHSNVLAVRVRRSDMQVRAIEMGTKASLAMMRLNFLMGNPLDTQLEPLDLPGALRFDDQPAMSEGMVDRAIESRPDLASARLRKEMARSAASAVKGGWYPSVALAAAYEYSNPNQRIIPPNDRFDGSWEVGVTFQWTVWDWMTTASQSAQAEAVHRQSEAGYELMMEGVKLEVAQLTLQLRDAGQKVESARFAVAAAEESFRVTEEQFSKGLATSVDLTDARVELLRAKLAFTQAVTEAAVTRAELRRAVGEGV